MALSVLTLSIYNIQAVPVRINQSSPMRPTNPVKKNPFILFSLESRAEHNYGSNFFTFRLYFDFFYFYFVFRFSFILSFCGIQFLASKFEIFVSRMYFNSLTHFSFHFCFVVAVPPKSKSDFWPNRNFSFKSLDFFRFQLLVETGNSFSLPTLFFPIQRQKTFSMDMRYIKLNLAAFPFVFDLFV